jgi:hypothetical protein
VAILNPEHLLEQAEKLIRLAPPGAPRQVDIRRAVSAAYYSVFHATMAAAADAFVGRGHRVSEQYSLVYRSIDHRGFKELCSVVQRSPLPARYRPHRSSGAFSPDLRAFATSAAELQDYRHAADYDPRRSFHISDGVLAIILARAALRHWAAAARDERTTFLMVLLFPPR